MERKTGCLVSPKDLRDYRIAKSKGVELPDYFYLNLSKSFKIKDQGNVGSCVAHALSSMLEKYNKIFSTGWIYGYRPEDYYQGIGMYPREALKTLQKIGAVENKDFPYNVEMNKAKELVDKDLNMLTKYAQEYKIQSYARLYNIKEIKEFLYINQTAVPVSILVDNMELVEDEIQVPNIENCEEGHMMLIVGWNEDGFIVQNSWGDNWGNRGFAILPYKYPIEEAWGVVLGNNENKEPVKKPMLYIIRKIIQTLIKIIKDIIREKE